MKYDLTRGMYLLQGNNLGYNSSPDWVDTTMTQIIIPHPIGWIENQIKKKLEKHKTKKPETSRQDRCCSIVVLRQHEQPLVGLCICDSSSLFPLLTLSISVSLSLFSIFALCTLSKKQSVFVLCFLSQKNQFLLSVFFLTKKNRSRCLSFFLFFFSLSNVYKPVFTLTHTKDTCPKKTYKKKKGDIHTYIHTYIHLYIHTYIHTDIYIFKQN